MDTVVLLAVERPWHYLLWVPLFASSVGYLMRVLTGYYRKVLVPQFEWSVLQEQRRRQIPEAGEPPAIGTPVPITKASPEAASPLAKAA